MNIFLRIEKWWRQRNYKMIYSDTYGYGVEEKLTSSIKRQWFLNHYDYIEGIE
jgi:hypothetical protein